MRMLKAGRSARGIKLALAAVVAVVVPVACGASGALAQDTDHSGYTGDFGLGLVIGDPTGLSAKYFLAEDQAIDFALGLGFIDDDGVLMHADYLVHFDLKRWESAGLDLYLGVGPKVALHEHGDDDLHVGLGLRAPFGLDMRFLEAPFDVFVEIAAGLWIIEDVDVYLDAAIGARFWF